MDNSILDIYCLNLISKHLDDRSFLNLKITCREVNNFFDLDAKAKKSKNISLKIFREIYAYVRNNNNSTFDPSFTNYLFNYPLYKHIDSSFCPICVSYYNINSNHIHSINHINSVRRNKNFQKRRCSEYINFSQDLIKLEFNQIRYINSMFKNNIIRTTRDNILHLI